MLKYRPRSQAEIRQRLTLRGFSEEAIAQVVVHLQGQGWLDDEAFARFWRQSREDHNPRSRRLLERELKQKGIASELAQRTTQDMDEEVAAFQAARKKLRLLSSRDYSTFQLKLGQFLRRRGFSWEVSRRAINRLWQERETS
ncbi:MAG: regulatory protein RecX [Chloroflexota bacterium]